MRRWVLPLNEEVEGVAVTRKEDGTFSFKVQKVEQRKYEVQKLFHAATVCRAGKE